MDLLPDTQNCGLHMHRECRERFPRHSGLAILACITTRAWRTCRDACRDRQIAVCLKSVAGKAFPAFLAHAQPVVVRIWPTSQCVFGMFRITVNDFWIAIYRPRWNARNIECVYLLHTSTYNLFCDDIETVFKTLQWISNMATTKCY